MKGAVCMQVRVRGAMCVRAGERLRASTVGRCVCRDWSMFRCVFRGWFMCRGWSMFRCVCKGWSVDR